MNVNLGKFFNIKILEKNNKINNWIIFSTIIYVMFLPFSFFLVDLCFFHFEYSNLFSIILMQTRHVPTMSIPVSICLMWISYFYKDFKKIKRFSLIPIFTFFIFGIFFVLINVIL